MPRRRTHLHHPRAQSQTRPGGRALLLAGVAVLWATGIALWLAAPEREPSEAIAAWHHPAFVVHLLLAWAAMFSIGRWAWPHVARRAPGRLRRVSGWSHAAGWLIVAGTGIGLQLLPEAARAVSGVVHWWLGLALPVAALAHLVRRGAHRP